MDLSGDSGTLPSHTTVAGPVLEQDPSLSNAHGQTGSGGTVLLQLLEFNALLLEAVEELHIRRDAETRFEDHNSKLVLENQQLEWDKESLQHQIETVTKQHTETLISVKKELQAKIRSSEEETGKYQVSAELKDKEINKLKEELKSLQLLKYNLEKKSSELEQKLSLQSRSKDRYLNQLGEVERRFSALSKQCAMIKQAHEKLEQNVDEAVKIKKKLTAANEKQEATIVSLKKELEEVRKNLIKTKMSSVRHDNTPSPPGQLQQLQHRLHMENEMNKKLQEENITVRAEKQEVMKSLQQTQQLLLSQTQTVNRVELELQTLREHKQALKQEHRLMGAEVARLMESYAASKNTWDKEKSSLVDCIKKEQQQLQAVKEAYSKLHQEHTEPSSQKRDSGQSLCVSAEGTVNEAISSSEQHLASTQTNNPDCLEDTGAGTKIVTPGAAGVSLGKETRDEGNGGTSEKEQGWKDDVKPEESTRGEGERHEEQQRAREDVRENRGALMAQTTDRADGQEESEGLTEDVEDPKQPGTETTDGAEDRGKTGTQTLVHTQQVNDSMNTEPSLAACESSPSLCQDVGEKEVERCHVNTGEEMSSVLFCSDEHQHVSDGPNSAITELQFLRHDELQTFAESVSPIHQALEKPSKNSATSIPSELCVSQTSTALSAAQSELRMPAAQPSDISRDTKQEAEECVLVRTSTEPQTLPQSEDLSQQTDDDGGDDAKKREGHLDADTRESIACITMGTVDPEPQVASGQQHVTNDLVEDDKMTKTESDLQLSVRPSDESDASAETGCCDPSPATEPLLGDSVQRKILVQGSSLPGPGGFLRTPPSTTPMFLKSQQHRVVTRMSDLLNVSSVSGTAASSRRRQTAAGPVSYTPSSEESRASLPTTSSKPFTWQPPLGWCSRAPTLVAGPRSESDQEPSASQEKEDQQSSFSAHIYKIQQFLETERLRQPKRQRTDN